MKQQNQSRIDKLERIALVAGVLLFGCLVLFFTIFLLRIRWAKSIVKELRKSSINEQVAALELIEANTFGTEVIIPNLIEVMISSVDSRNQQSAIQMARLFKERVVDAADDKFWDILKTSVDKSHNGFISRIAQCHNMKKNDLRFIELCCCGFSYVEIAIIMGYSPNYISTKRKNIARKLKIDNELEVYLREQTKFR